MPTTEKPDVFWDFVQGRAEELGISLSEFARRIGVSRPMIEKYKGGSLPEHARVPRVARALNVPLSEVARFWNDFHVLEEVRTPLDPMPRGVEVYPTRGAFLERVGDTLSDDEIEYLRSQFFKSGDPGERFWPAALKLYREFRDVSRGHDATADLIANPPLDTGVTLVEMKTHGDGHREKWPSPASHPPELQTGSRVTAVIGGDPDDDDTQAEAETDVRVRVKNPGKPPPRPARPAKKAAKKKRR